MRWPIRFQLLLPTLSVVVLAIALASGVSAYVGSHRARQAQEENLRRVVTTLAEAPFPLSEPVLQQMRGLSGADFVFFDQQESLQASTLRLEDRELVPLLEIPIHNDRRSAHLSTSPTVSLQRHVYLSQRVAVAPHAPTSRAGSLVVLYPEDRWWAAARQAAYPALLAGAVAVGAVVLVTTLVAHRFVQPIHHLQQRAAAIAQGDFQPVAVPHRNDEIRDLALSLNQMAEQLSQFEIQVRRHEQLRTLSQLGAGMAHQLRNAATGGRMAIELHQRECHDSHAGETLDVALRQLQLMESYLQRFLAVGRAHPLAPENLSLAGVVQSAITLLQPTCNHAGIPLIYRDPTTPFWIQGDADALRQLILNLVLNAMEAIGEKLANSSTNTSAANNTLSSNNMSGPSPKFPKGMPQQITVEIEPQGDDRVALNVRDTGPGLADDVARRLFEPFVTNKAQGTGLGLYVARQVAEAHHGSIVWRRIANETCFSVTLPLIQDPIEP
jgi:signal transduction histidine kinase